MAPTALPRLQSATGRWIVLATVLGSAVASLDATVVNVALPEIGRALDSDVAGLQWILSGYTLTLASFILLGGALGDRLGRRRVFVWGTVGFAVTSLICGLANNVETLILARIAQGVAAALLTPGSLALIAASIDDRDQGAAIGLWSGLGGVAGAVGPLVGGWLIEVASWRAVFLINLPVAAAVVWVSARHVPESRDPDAPARLDLPGARGGRTWPGRVDVRSDYTRPGRGGGGRGAARPVRGDRDPQRPPPGAAVAVRLARLHRGEPRHARGLRGPRRRVLPLVAAVADRLGLPASHSRRRDHPDHAADARAVVAGRQMGPEARAPDSDDHRPAAGRRGCRDDDPNRRRRRLPHRRPARRRRVRPRPVRIGRPAHRCRPRVGAHRRVRCRVGREQRRRPHRAVARGRGTARASRGSARPASTTPLRSTPGSVSR